MRQASRRQDAGEHELEARAPLFTTASDGTDCFRDARKNPLPSVADRAEKRTASLMIESQCGNEGGVCRLPIRAG